MARHGYLREYDEAPDRSENREEGSRVHSWREDDWSDRKRGFMFDQDGRPARDRGEERQWTGSGESDWRRGGHDREHGHGGFERDFSPPCASAVIFVAAVPWKARLAVSAAARTIITSAGATGRSGLSTMTMPTIAENASSSSIQTSTAGVPTGSGAAASRPWCGEMAELELTQERVLAGEGNTPSPVGEATLGTSNSENTSPGRR